VYICISYRRRLPSCVCIQTFPGFEESPAPPEHAVFWPGLGVADTTDMFAANEVTNTIATSVAIKSVLVIFFVILCTTDHHLRTIHLYIKILYILFIELEQLFVFTYRV
jgi:hypothetical protein